MPKIFLARHGQTESNRNGLVMGRSNSPLTEEGIAATRRLARALDGEPIEAIFSSPLGRAAESARIYSKTLGSPMVLKEALAELSCGLWEGKLRVSVVGDTWQLRSAWQERPPGGESYRDAELRVSGLIEEIGPRDRKDAIMLVGHAGVNRVLLKLLLDLNPDVAMRIRCPHDVVYVVDGRGTLVRRSAAGDEIRGLLFEKE
jgi:broad specificity phosphatase PhoE